MRFTSGILFAALLLVPNASLAQTAAPGPQGRIFLDVNVVGVDRSTASDRTFTSLFLSSSEIGTARATYSKPGIDLSALTDLGAGYMFTPRFGVGLGVVRTSHQGAVRLDAIVPDPLIWGAPARTVSNQLLTRREVSVNLFVTVTKNVSDRVSMRLSGGPSWFRYRSDMVSGLSFEYSADPATLRSTVAIASFSTAPASGSAMGYHAGLEMTYFFNNAVGLATGVTFGRGIVTVDREPFSKVTQRFVVGRARTFVGVRFHLGR